MNLLALTITMPGLIERTTLGLPALTLITIPVVLIALLVWRFRRGGLAVLVVGTCMLCALLVLFLAPARRHISQRLRHLEPTTYTIHSYSTAMPEPDWDQVADQDCCESDDTGPCDELPECDELRKRGSSAVARVNAVPAPRVPPAPLARATAPRPGGKHSLHGERLPLHWTLVSGLALAAMIYLAYLFVDSGTRGHFTWPLRIFSVLAFVAICVFLVFYGRGF
ncbi:MAG TPA: hypothetical protein VM243_04335 [Phycisphaerae bacterium]|nr:hypothetical protein [Phycisphaerae bacterium]